HPVTNGLVEAPEIKQNILTRDRDEYEPFDLDIDHPLRPNLRPGAPVGWHIPAVGGDPLFANLEALYESLSPSLRGYLDTLQAIHVRDDAAVGRPPPPRFDGRDNGPFAALHPLARVAPQTRK